MTENLDKYTLKDFFHLWYKHERSAPNVGPARYMRIARDLLKEIGKRMVNTPGEYKLPKRLGSIVLKKTKYKTGNIDFVRSRKEGKQIRNPHSVRVPIYVFSWQKSKADFSNMEFYRFKVVRGKASEYWGKEGLTQYQRDNIEDPFVKDFDRL